MGLVEVINLIRMEYDRMDEVVDPVIRQRMSDRIEGMEEALEVFSIE